MKQPLVHPKSSEGDAQLQELIEFYEETLGFCPNSANLIYIGNCWLMITF